MTQKTIQYKRYRLHQTIKDEFEYDVKNKLVKIPHNYCAKNYPNKVVKALNELKKMNYQLQTQIC